MGRGKSSIKFITNEKLRKSTFTRRKKSLMRKAYELSTLCDVGTCVFIYGPKQDDQSAREVHTWPQHRSDVEDMIKAYKAKSAHKVYDLNDFFSEQQKKVEAEIMKTRQIKYPKWNDSFEFLQEDQLRLLRNDLDSEIARIDLLMDNHTHHCEGTLEMAASFKPEFLFEEQNPAFENETQMSFHHQMIPTFLSEDYRQLLINDFDSKIDATDLFTENEFLNSDFKQDFLFEEQTPTFGDDNQMLFHHQIPIEEAAPSFTMSPNLFSGNSISMVPIDHDVDLSQLLFGSNEPTQIPYNEYGNFQSFIYYGPMNGMMENNDMTTLMDPNYSMCHYVAAPSLPLSYMQFADPVSNSPMMFADASGQVNNQYDLAGYEY